MAEYIEREALINSFRSCGASKDLIDSIVYRINLQEAADVEPVRHAHWNYRCPIDGNSYRYCSKCLSAVYDSVLYVSKTTVPIAGRRWMRRRENERKTRKETQIQSAA